MFLDSDELRIFTGFKHSDKQIQVLVRRGIPFDVAKKKPVVLRSAIEQRLGLKIREQKSHKVEINLAPLKRMNNGKAKKPR
jgi:hypothetical protein